MTAPTLTPDNLRAIRIWYDALLSGKYKELPEGQRFDNYRDGCYCAVGVAQEVLGAWSHQVPGHSDFSRPCLNTFLPRDTFSELIKFFFDPSRSFRDCAARLRDYVLEKYCVDIDDPAPAPSESEAKHVG